MEVYFWGERFHENTSYDHPNDETGARRGQRGDKGDGDFSLVVAGLSPARLRHFLLGREPVAA